MSHPHTVAAERLGVASGGCGRVYAALVRRLCGAYAVMAPIA
jgi:hypothetical protein